MCGIAGIFHNGLLRYPERTLDIMKNQIAHRGPDGEGSWMDSMAALGHVRLAILDVESGHQPMTTPDGRFTIIFNGEIYNYKALQQELKGLGYAFKTDCDTEVVLAAWSRWAEGCLNRLNGMFAFAIWDSRQEKGFLVRDPFGIKPLFYCTKRNNILYFASEVKAILPVLGDKPSLEISSLHLLMNFRYLPGDTTLWKDIKQLLPCHILCWTSKGYSLRKWSSILEPEMFDEGSIEHVRQRVTTLIEHAVESQLISHVPLGGYLSYGIDSGIISAIAAQKLQDTNSSYPTFTIATGDSPQEAKGAAETARLLGLPNFQEEIDLDVAKIFKSIIWHLEVPKVNALQSYLVARLATKHVKVALSGLGGDEVFLGYNIHRLFTLYNRLHRKGFVSSLLKSMGSVTRLLFDAVPIHMEEFARGIIFLSEKEPWFSYGIMRNLWDGIIDRNLIYGPRVLDEQSELVNPFEIVREKWQVLSNDPLKSLQFFELREKMVNDLLWNEDRVSMAQGLEVRVPFLDIALADFGIKCPSSFLLLNGNLKGLLKEVAQTWLPKHIINRPKSGFQVPIHEVFQQHLRPLCKVYLNEQSIKKRGLFNYLFIKRVLDARPSKRLRWHYFMLYMMLGMAVWLEIFEENSGTR